MNKYHYASLSLQSLLSLARVPTPPDSFTSDDAESQAAKALLNNGYRLHSVHGDTALFEREFEGLPARVVAALQPERPNEYHDRDAVIREMLEDAELEHGEDVCDCRPEPENDGHVCCFCKARAILGMFKPPHPEQLPDEPDPRSTTTLYDENP